METGECAKNGVIGVRATQQTTSGTIDLDLVEGTPAGGSLGCGETTDCIPEDGKGRRRGPDGAGSMFHANSVVLVSLWTTRNVLISKLTKSLTSAVITCYYKMYVTCYHVITRYPVITCYHNIYTLLAVIPLRVFFTRRRLSPPEELPVDPPPPPPDVARNDLMKRLGLLLGDHQQAANQTSPTDTAASSPDRTLMTSPMTTSDVSPPSTLTMGQWSLANARSNK